MLHRIIEGHTLATVLAATLVLFSLLLSTGVTASASDASTTTAGPTTTTASPTTTTGSPTTTLDASSMSGLHHEEEEDEEFRVRRSMLIVGIIIGIVLLLLICGFCYYCKHSTQDQEKRDREEGMGKHSKKKNKGQRTPDSAADVDNGYGNSDRAGTTANPRPVVGKVIPAPGEDWGRTEAKDGDVHLEFEGEQRTKDGGVVLV